MMIVSNWKWIVHTINLDDDIPCQTAENAADEATSLIRHGFSVVVKSPSQNAYECLACILDHDAFKVCQHDAIPDELVKGLEERLQARECIEFIRSRIDDDCVNNMTPERLKTDLEDKEKILDMFSA